MPAAEQFAACRSSKAAHQALTSLQMTHGQIYLLCRQTPAMGITCMVALTKKCCCFKRSSLP